MKRFENMGTADKAIRIVVASVIVFLFVFQVITGPLAVVLLSLAAVLILTSLFSFCPLYRLFGVGTYRKRES